MRQQIINKLSRAIEKYGLTISEIARQLNISQPALYNIYYGKRVGSVKTLELIESWKPRRKG